MAILSLALGIGANTAIFSILDSLLLRTLPVEDPRQLVMLRDAGGTRTTWTNPIWEQVRQHESLFDGAFAWAGMRFNLARGGQTDLVDGLWASGRMFDVLGVPAILGRTFTEADDRHGGGPDGPVAVISYGLWQRRFEGAADVIGRTLTVERVPFTIIGVTPPQFFGLDVGRTFDVAIPIGTEPLMYGQASRLDGRTTWWLNVMVRLKQSQAARAGEAALRGVLPQIREPAFDIRSYLHKLTGTDLSMIHGIGPYQSLRLISEIGTDMSRWATPELFHRLAPSRPEQQDHRWPTDQFEHVAVVDRAAEIFRMAAMAAGRTQSALGAFYRRLAARIGKSAANTATARKIAILVYRVLKGRRLSGSRTRRIYRVTAPAHDQRA